MKKNKPYRSDFLFSDTNFLSGVGSAFNLSGNYYSFNESASGMEADFKAIASDWGAIGHDLENSMHNVGSIRDKNQLKIDF